MKLSIKQTSALDLLEDNLTNDIKYLYAMYEQLEIQVKQLDDYQNGRLNY